MNTPPHLHIVSNQHCWLSAQRCMYWEEKRMLILADLHWGKTGHFRKHGIAVPTGISKEDLQRLTQQITHFRPEQVMIVGDMFHSYANKELDQWIRWRNDFSAMEFMLIKGNHDVLSLDWYAAANIQVYKEQLAIDPFIFIHDAATIASDYPEANTIISGHLHPGIAMKGKGKQHLRFPCFFHATPHLYLPAFSHFSGMAIIEPKKHQEVFAIVNDQIIPL